MKKLTVVFVLLTVFLAAGEGLADWNPQTVDNSNNVGKYTSIAYDSQGYPHIAYYDGYYGDLKYTHWNGTAWQTEVVRGCNPAYPSLALDSLERPHIALASGSYIYYCWKAGTWDYDSFTASAASGSGQRVSMVLVADNPHIAFWGGPELRYTYKSGETWPITDVDVGDDLGQYASMAIDASGKIYISYYDEGGGDLKFAYRNLVGTWSTFIVDGATVDVGEHSSLVLDESGVPHVAYYDATNNQLKHVEITGLP